jgi:hypothetical protein
MFERGCGPIIPTNEALNNRFLRDPFQARKVRAHRIQRAWCAIIIEVEKVQRHLMIL